MSNTYAMCRALGRTVCELRSRGGQYHNWDVLNAMFKRFSPDRRYKVWFNNYSNGTMLMRIGYDNFLIMLLNDCIRIRPYWGSESLYKKMPGYKITHLGEPYQMSAEWDTEYLF